MKKGKIVVAEWKMRVRSLLYKQGHCAFNISEVDNIWWNEEYEDGSTPREAIDKANEEALDNQQ